MQLAPDFCWGWFELGHLQRHQGKLSAASSSLKRALELQPVQARHHHNLIREALEEVRAQLGQQERQEAALSLWPDRPVPQQGERLSSLDELELQLEQFNLFLNRQEPNGQEPNRQEPNPNRTA